MNDFESFTNSAIKNKNSFIGIEKPKSLGIWPNDDFITARTRFESYWCQSDRPVTKVTDLKIIFLSFSNIENSVFRWNPIFDVHTTLSHYETEFQHTLKNRILFARVTKLLLFSIIFIILLAIFSKLFGYIFLFYSIILS